MVLIFFCVSGVLGAIGRHPSITTREGAPAATRSLESDVRLFAETIESFPGALVAVGNDWPLVHNLPFLREACASFRHRIVNSVRLVSETKEESILAFMEPRCEPYAVVTSPDFEFSDVTAGMRVDVGFETGFNEKAADRLRTLLEGFGEAAKRPASGEEVLSATVNNPLVQRLQGHLAQLRPPNYLNGQRKFVERLYARRA
ncbi:hypothetical protein [Paraburkholderia dinghuensis]|uniref:hypothetical protein n=1 Tax=Paraburkholderia dinghuensis TaxID=2305225 RepID=UPI00162AE448|nr:hypothetical protein [Paraburkholderia dinghuensis]